MSTSREQPNRERLLRISQVLSICPVSKAHLYLMIQEGDFPRPVRVGKRAVAWRESEITQWIATRPEASECNWR